MCVRGKIERVPFLFIDVIYIKRRRPAVVVVVFFYIHKESRESVCMRRSNNAAGNNGMYKNYARYNDSKVRVHAVYAQRSLRRQLNKTNTISHRHPVA